MRLITITCACACASYVEPLTEGKWREGGVLMQSFKNIEFANMKKCFILCAFAPTLFFHLVRQNVQRTSCVYVLILLFIVPL